MVATDYGMGLTLEGRLSPDGTEVAGCKIAEAIVACYGARELELHGVEVFIEVRRRGVAKDD